MKNYIKKGEVLDFVNGTEAAIVSGQLVVVAGGLNGVAVTNIAIGETGAVNLKGCYELPKAAGAITQGAKLYWVVANSNITTTVSTNVFIGYAAEAALSGDATVKVTLANGI